MNKCLYVFLNKEMALEVSLINVNMIGIICSEINDVNKN